MSNRTVSAIVVFRRTDFIASCLESLDRQTAPALETIVIDNSCDPSFRDGLQRRYPAVRWLVRAENMPYGAALNAGIRESRGEFVLCLNDDVQLEPEYLKRAVQGFSFDDKVGMVSGKILRFDKVTIDSTGQFLTFVYTARERGYGRRDAGQFEQPQEVFGVTGAVALYRRQMLEAIQEKNGYFDPDFGYFYEDLDMSWRARRSGWIARYIPTAKAYHARGGTVRRSEGRDRWPARNYLSDDLYCNLIKNRYLMIRKNERPWRYFLRLPLVVLYDLAQWLHLVIFRPRLLRKISRRISL